MYNPGSTINFREALEMNWARMLAYITGTVDQELLVRNEYLARPLQTNRQTDKVCLPANAL
jgi:hypothetical protein